MPNSNSTTGAPKCAYRQQELGEKPIVLIAGDVSLTRAVPALQKRKIKDLNAPDFDMVILDESKPSDWESDTRLLDLGGLKACLRLPIEQEQRLLVTTVDA